MCKPIPTFSADELTAIAVDVQESRLVIAAYQGDAIHMAPGQFARLVEQAKDGLVIGRRNVMRAIDGEASQ